MNFQALTAGRNPLAAMAWFIASNPARDPTATPYGLVAVTSALGQGRHASLNLGLPEAQRWVGYGMGHLDLLSRVAVYEQTKDWLTLLTRR